MRSARTEPRAPDASAKVPRPSTIVCARLWCLPRERPGTAIRAVSTTEPLQGAEPQTTSTPTARPDSVIVELESDIEGGIFALLEPRTPEPALAVGPAGNGE